MRPARAIKVHSCRCGWHYAVMPCHYRLLLNVALDRDRGPPGARACTGRKPDVSIVLASGLADSGFVHNAWAYALAS